MGQSKSRGMSECGSDLPDQGTRIQMIKAQDEDGKMRNERIKW